MHGSPAEHRPRFDDEDAATVVEKRPELPAKSQQVRATRRDIPTR
jgi:hypothetical protein